MAYVGYHDPPSSSPPPISYDPYSNNFGVPPLNNPLAVAAVPIAAKNPFSRPPAITYGGSVDLLPATETGVMEARVVRRLKREQLRTKLTCTECRGGGRECIGNLPNCHSCTLRGLECIPHERRLIIEDGLNNVAFGVFPLGTSDYDDDDVDLPAMSMETVPADDADFRGRKRTRPVTERPWGFVPPEDPRSFRRAVRYCRAFYPAASPVDADMLPSCLYRVGTSASEMAFNRAPLYRIPEPYSSYVWRAPVLSLFSDIYDTRLQHCDFQFWTTVPIPHDLALRAISLYFLVDHPLIGPFYDEFFIRSLVSRTPGHCSSLLFNAIMFWACQTYSGIAEQARHLVVPFRDAAVELLEMDPSSPCVLAMAATQFLSFGFLAQGHVDECKRYFEMLVNRARACQLFGNGQKIPERHMKTVRYKANCYAAWGIFNFVIMIKTFYIELNLPDDFHRPTLPIPKGIPDIDDPTIGVGQRFRPAPPTFTVVSQLWSIMFQRAKFKFPDEFVPAQLDLSLAELQWKLGKLTTWSALLPRSLALDEYSPSHVIVLHMWLQASMMTLLEPFVDRNLVNIRFNTPELASQSGRDTYVDCTNKLKRLVVVYRMNYDASSFTLLWHPALHSVAHAVTKDFGGPDSSSYLRVVLYAYKNLRSSFPAVGQRVVDAVLGQAVERRFMTGQQADELRRKLTEADGQRPHFFGPPSRYYVDEPYRVPWAPVGSREEERALWMPHLCGTQSPPIEPGKPVDFGPMKVLQRVIRDEVYSEDGYIDDEDVVDDDAWLDLIVNGGR